MTLTTNPGGAAATAFAESGAAVVVADLDRTALDTAVDQLSAAGRQVLGIQCNVALEHQVEAMINQTVATFGRLDMAFNNAGIAGPSGDLADESSNDFDTVTAVNLRGVWTCLKHELREMRSQGSGAIVNTSSLGGLVGLPGRASYHATKHGVIGLTKSTGRRVRAAGYKNQRHLPRRHPHPDGRRHDRKPPGSDAGVPPRPAHRASGDRRRGRRRRSLAVQSCRRSCRRSGPARGRRLHRPLTRLAARLLAPVAVSNCCSA